MRTVHSVLSLSVLLAATAVAPPAAAAGPGATTATKSAAPLDGDDATVQKAFMLGSEGLRIRNLRHHQGKRGTQYEIEVGAPTRDQLPTAPAKLTVTSAAADGTPIRENVSLNFADIELRRQAVQPKPTTPGSYVYTALRTDAKGRKLAVESCTLELVAGSSCTTKGGDSFSVLPSPKVSDSLVVDYAHLHRADVDEPAQQNVKVTVKPTKGSTSLAPESMTLVFWSATGTYNRPRSTNLDHVGAYNFMVEISGVNAGAFKAASTFADQFGEILIDGVVWELE